MKKLTLFIVSAFIIQASVYSQPCLPDGIIFTTQAQIDNFQINYPGCTEIEGDVEINGNNITNLNGLSILTSIGGNLEISCCDSLNSLQGLHNVQIIGGYLHLSCNSFPNLDGLQTLTTITGDFMFAGELNNLTGLENLQTIGGSVHFGYETMGGTAHSLLISMTGIENLNSIGGNLNIYCNSLLEGLTGLSGLTHIGENLSIRCNPALTSLTGLENIDAGSIERLFIEYNPNLSECAVQSICDFLASPNGDIYIYGNANGCNNQQEVQEACWIVNIGEGQTAEDQITIYPNPLTSTAKLSGQFATAATVNICIYNITGICLKSWEFANHQSGKQEFTLNLSDLPPGIYFLRLQVGNEVKTKKIIKVN